MLAKSLILWMTFAFLGLSAAAMLVEPDAKVATLGASLGPVVTAEAL